MSVFQMVALPQLQPQIREEPAQVLKGRISDAPVIPEAADLAVLLA